jgi:hypothetical protein
MNLDFAIIALCGYLDRISKIVLIYKVKKKSRTEGVAQVVECLPTKCKALSTNPSTTIINKQINNRKENKV